MSNEPGQIEEKEWIERILSGNKELFGNLVERYWKRVFALTYRIFRNPTLAEDMTQEAFLKAFSKLDSYNPDFPFHNWLSRVATNLCLDQIRKLKKERGSVSLEFMDESGSLQGVLEKYHSEESAENSFLEILEIEEQKKYLEIALSELNEKERALLTLFYQEGLPLKEIAATLEVTENTAKVGLFRARGKLKKILEIKTGCNPRAVSS